ncbi:hypothetical protein BT69DRAFT_1344370 [Atractiella rhizophila]|nr:hypothetical protein BT69DRAFT_1344370 [Atractiella rhizophila]
MQDFTWLPHGNFQCRFCPNFQASKVTAWRLHEQREKHVRARNRYLHTVNLSSSHHFIDNHSYSSAIKYHISSNVPAVQVTQLGEIVSEFIDNSWDWVAGELDPALGVNFNEGLVEGFTRLHLQEQVANEEWELGRHIMEESNGDEAFNYQMDNLDGQSSDEDADFEAEPAWMAISFAGNNAPTTHAAIEESEEYFPYPNKQHMYCDILLNFLRNDISEPL